MVTESLVLGGFNMSVTVQSFGIDRLPRDQRIALVQEIWDTIAAESSQPLLTQAQCRELERRVAEDDAHPDDGVPWEQVKAQILSRLPS
jgi:putative addiction module component (TIGR02574 family)